MDTRKVTLFATIAAIALVAVGIGYAYTAITENTGNNATDEYVVLSQTNYTYASSAVLYFNTVNGETGTDHELLKSIEHTDYAPIVKVDSKATYDSEKDNKGVLLYGLQLGNTDTLKAKYTGTGNAPASYTVTVEADDFSDLSDKPDWKYVIMVYRTGEEYQFATYDGNSTATYYIWNASTGWVSNTTGFVLTKDTGNTSQSYEYTTAVFFAGTNINNDPKFAHSLTTPGETDPNVITAGKLKFVYTKDA